MTQPDPDAQSGVDGTQSGAGDGTSTSDPTTQSTGAQSGASDGVTQQQATTEPTVTKAQHDQLRTQLQAADRKRQEAENQLQQLRDKDLPEAERAKRDLEGLRTENAQLKERLQSSAINNQFLLDNTHPWHDPKTALQLLDRSGLTVGDDYTVAGMKQALAELAKTHPYLLKTEPGNTNTNGGAAVPPMNGQPASGNTAAKKAVTQRFPAARSRLGG